MNDQESLRLHNQLCFTVYACSREMTKLYRPILNSLQITYPQYLVLLVLWEHKNITVTELGNQLFLDSGTLTPLLKRLEDHQLILRKRSVEDERRVVISLSEKGEKLRERALEVPPFLIEQSGLTSEEYLKLLEEFQGLLTKLTAAKEEQ
ncbi:MarR family transcriptional regulator [Bacillus lacus]|uniref:MarR family transcriptional regulator n=1 Tax=Metabacillus lacus TaxID=1983721 RepID=A0A7X2LWY8_9BACI|nr:MarR family transcriptional regulator [Metabacillus lacus]MRX71990.1 MarR family transcriptional regulator [Metabacillus lacus]